MVETDYPHGDGTWPDTQSVIDTGSGAISRSNEIRAMCCENAAQTVPTPVARTRVAESRGA